MATKTLSPPIFRALQALTKELDRDLPITALMVFVRAAEAGPEGMERHRLQDELQASTAQMSRMVGILGRIHYHKEKEGLGLIDYEVDPRDWRHRIIKLSPRGERLYQKFLNVLQKGHE